MGGCGGGGGSRGVGPAQPVTSGYRRHADDFTWPTSRLVYL